MPVAESASYSPGASLRLSPLQGLLFPVSPVSFWFTLVFMGYIVCRLFEKGCSFGAGRRLLGRESLSAV